MENKITWLAFTPQTGILGQIQNIKFKNKNKPPYIK